MPLNPTVTQVTTVGNATLSAAQLLSGNILRSGPAAPFIDTTDTAANIIAAIGPAGGFNGSWRLLYVNNTASVATLAGGVGVTTGAGSASLAIPANSEADIIMQVTASGQFVVAAVTITVVSRNSVT